MQFDDEIELDEVIFVDTEKKKGGVETRSTRKLFPILLPITEAGICPDSIIYRQLLKL